MSGGERTAAGGLAVGAGVLVVVVGLFNRVVRPATEINRYATHVDQAIKDISRNLDGAEALLTTRDVALAVPGLAGAYLARLGVVDAT